MRQAFSMIELVFVIVILGILASVAIPKLNATRKDAQISKGRADLSAIRSAIVSDRQAHLIKGDSRWISGLAQNSTTLFDTNGSDDRTLLMYGVTAGTTSGHWSVDSNDDGNFTKFVFKVGSDDCKFEYNSTSGKFALQDSQPVICDELVK